MIQSKIAYSASVHISDTIGKMQVLKTKQQQRVWASKSQDALAKR